MKRNKKQQLRYLTKRSYKRFQRKLKRKTKSRNLHFFSNLTLIRHEIIDYVYQKLNEKSYLNVSIEKNTKVIKIPTKFSLVDNPKDSFKVIHDLIYTLYNGTSNEILIDYKNCVKIDLEAQVYLDIVLKYFISYFRKLSQRNQYSPIKRIDGVNLNNEEVRKVLFSVGTLAILRNKKVKFKDIIPYRLSIGCKTKPNNSERQEIDTTELVEYVIKCLEVMGKRLTPVSRTDLCQVIGEVLGNAEEHSTTNYRYSIGYFQDKKSDSQHYGIFNLVILNYGSTIYEKFKSPDCPTKHIVKRMSQLSKKYTTKKMFTQGEFTEETLWTLYSLQEGITSSTNYKKRGNGSIRFIESFLNLGNFESSNEELSKLVLMSGNTKITFDGEYMIKDKLKNNNKFKVMTFNESGDIENIPDKEKVTSTDYYFPGTLISAKIILNENDFIK